MILHLAPDRQTGSIYPVYPIHYIVYIKNSTVLGNLCAQCSLMRRTAVVAAGGRGGVTSVSRRCHVGVTSCVRYAA